MKKSFILLLALGLASLSFGRVGPVSQYGELKAGKDSNGQGRIFGSCAAYSNTPVQVKGMSLYWSLLDNALEFWTADAISKMISDMKIQIIRAAMATGSENWGGPASGYASDASKQKNYVNTVVQAAIDQDIYVIIDWHSHEANNQTESAKGFFSEMAQKWGKYDNVIFEIFNEPTKQSWGEVKNYANQVIQVIRQYSDNLIVVGNPSWSATPNSAVNAEVTGSNIAYTFHYYACSHSTNNEGKNVTAALNAGLPVFVTEWGTGNSDGTGDGSSCQSANQQWQTFMDNNKLSWANWSASKISEGTAAFTGGANRYSLSYSTSGNMVKGFLSSNPTSYTACGQTPSSSSSRGGYSSSSRRGNKYDDNTAIAAGTNVSMSVSVSGKILHVSGVESASVDVFDLQGRAIVKNSVISGSLSLEGLNPGSYVFRVKSGTLEKVLRLQVR